MSPKQRLEQLLEDMDTVRPVIIAARPDDKALRATTRRIVSNLEIMRRNPGTPAATYLWLRQLTSRLLDAEHSALLIPSADGDIPAADRQSIQTHSEQRHLLLMDAMQSIPVARRLLDQCCALVGQKPTDATSVQDKARHLNRCLRAHLTHDAALRQELQQLVEALNPSLDAISTLIQEVGEDAPELQQVRELLEQALPDDAEQARQLLQDARLGIAQVGAKLASVSKQLRSSMQNNLEKLSEMSGKLAQAESDARNDPLTELANRRYLSEFISALGNSVYCFVICDIDHFKHINDTYGHDTGDEVLRQLAVILKESIRTSDLAARVGGEEFCIVFPDTDLQTSATLAESLRQAVDIYPFKTEQGDIAVNISIGVAAHKQGTAYAATFKAADKALYQAKENGRNQVSIAPLQTKPYQ